MKGIAEHFNEYAYVAVRGPEEGVLMATIPKFLLVKMVDRDLLLKMFFMGAMAPILGPQVVSYLGLLRE